MTLGPDHREQSVNPELISRTHDLGCLVGALHDAVESRVQSDIPFVVRISGFGSLGKTTLADALARSFASASVIQTDGYQVDRETRRARNLPNGDNPTTIDFVAMQQAITQLISGNPVDNRKYNHETGKNETIGQILPSKLIILDGASSLYSQLQLNVPSFGIFLDADDDTKLHIRYKVQVDERGYTWEQAARAMPGWLEGYRDFILPSQKNAEVIIEIDSNRRYKSSLIIHCICTDSSE